MLHFIAEPRKEWLPPEPQPLRLAHEPDKSATGFILRVAARNLCSGNEMAERLGLPKLDHRMNVDPGPSARLLGIEPEKFAHMGFEDNASGWVLGHRVPFNRLHLSQRFVCPDCLAEAPYHRRIWSLRQLDVCPRHGRELIRRCPECKAALLWGGQASMQSCYCGAPLDVPGSSAAVEDSTGASVVYLHCNIPAPGNGLPSVFAGLPLSALFDLLIFFGRMDLIIAQRNPDGLKPREMLTDRRILNAGARIALGWPGSFDDLADRVRAARHGKQGVGREYGYLHRFIMRSGTSPYAGLLRGAYASHLARRDNISDRAWPPSLPRPSAQLEALLPLEAQRLLGLGRNSFSALRTHPLWTDIKPVTSARNGTYQYARADIESLKEKLSRMGTPGVVDRSLGLGRGKTAQLVEAGLITAYNWNRNHRNSEQRSVDVADVEALFERIRSLAVAAEPARLVTFEALQRMAIARRVVSFVDLVRCLLSGRLRGHLCDNSNPGLSAVVFEKADAEKIMNRLASPAESGKMILAEVVRCLRIRAKGVHDLVGAGLLPQPQRICAYIFDTRAIAEFRENFTFDFALARQHRAQPEEIRKALAAIGIRPVTTVTMRVTRAAVYRKSELPPALRPQILSSGMK